MESWVLRPGDTTVVRVPIVDQIFVAAYLTLINKRCFANLFIIFLELMNETYQDQIIIFLFQTLKIVGSMNIIIRFR